MQLRSVAELEDIFDDGPKPTYGFSIELVIDGWSIHYAFDPASVTKHFEMLGSGCLRDGQVFNNVTGDAIRMSDQKFHDLKTDGIPQRLEHRNQSILVKS